MLYVFACNQHSGLTWISNFLCSDDEGNVDKEALVRAHDAMLSKDGKRRDVSSALSITSQERLYVIQVTHRATLLFISSNWV